jgi:curved DNA-binding protein CbpA
MKSRTMRWVGNTAHMGEMKNAYKSLVRKFEPNRPPDNHRHRLEGIIKMDLK